MSERPEYVRCIRSPFEDQRGKSLCGRTIGVDFAMGLEHFYCSVAGEGRLQGCPTCVDAAISVLAHGAYKVVPS